MRPTQHQQKAIEDSILKLKGSNYLLIKGSAGVGKTFIVNELINRLNRGRTIFCSAPTNKAVAVIRGKVDEKSNLQFLTTHSAMKLKKNIDYKTGAISFKPYFSEKYPPLKGVDIFVIDEASMLNKDLLGYIEQYSERFGVRVIFIGDEKQLPPVKESVSPIFTRGYPEVELTEIVRQAEGNPIIALSRNLSMLGTVKDLYTEDDETEEKQGFLYSNDREQVVETLAFVNGSDKLKYLAFTNNEVDTMNRDVRTRIYGNPNKLEVGESMIFNSPYKKEFYTNEEIKIEQLEIREKKFEYMSDKYGTTEQELGEAEMYGYVNLKHYVINPEKENVIVIHEDSEDDYNKTLSLMKSKTKVDQVDWKDFYEFQEKFADLKYNHAITIHKSQGSTFKQVIVNIRNINICRDKSDKDKLLYTAVTRASNLLILYNT